MSCKWTRRRVGLLAALSVCVAVAATLAAAAIGGSLDDPPSLPPGKAALEKQMEEFQRQGTPASRAEVNKTRPASIPDPKPFEGVSNEGVSAPLPPSAFIFGGSAWQKVFGPQLVTVYAATLGGGGDQGTLVVFTRALPNLPASDQFEPGVESYPTPGKVGMIRIESERGGLIHAVSVSGSTEFTFNFAARKYVGSS